MLVLNFQSSPFNFHDFFLLPYTKIEDNLKQSENDFHMLLNSPVPVLQRDMNFICLS